MPNTQTAGGTSAQPYGMYLPMPAAGHHNMIHQPIHQVHSELPLQVVVGEGEDSHVLIHESGPQVTYQIWQDDHPDQCQDQSVDPHCNNFEQNIDSYQDDVSGISFFAD